MPARASASAPHSRLAWPGLPFLPGATSPTEILVAREHGYTDLKFFPAELYGGTRWLQHMAPLFPDVSFCPTGGITASNLHEFLALPNRFMVGGAFMAPRQAINATEWLGIQAESLQRTGSFKVRGAWNRLALRTTGKVAPG